MTVDSPHKIRIMTVDSSHKLSPKPKYKYAPQYYNIRNVFASASRTSGRTAKRTPPFDSAHRIGVFPLSRGVLNVDEGVCRWWFKNRRMRNVFASASRSKGRTGKWRAALDSAHQIGVSTLSRGVLTVDEGACGWRFKIHRIGNVFDYTGRGSRDTAKRMVRLDSARQIGLCTIWRGVLTEDEGVCGWEI